MPYADLESMLVSKNKGNPDESFKVLQFYRLAVMATNYYELMISLVNLLSHTWVNMLFTVLLVVWSKKVNIVLYWCGKEKCSKKHVATKEDNEGFENSTKC